MLKNKKNIKKFQMFEKYILFFFIYISFSCFKQRTKTKNMFWAQPVRFYKKNKRKEKRERGRKVGPQNQKLNLQMK